MERREAQRPTSLGARGFALGPREAGPLIPPQRVPRKHSGASRRSIALATTRGPANLGRIAPRERGNTPVIPGRRYRTAQGAARWRRTRNPDVIAYNTSGFRVRAEEARPGMTEFPLGKRVDSKNFQAYVSLGIVG